MVAVSLVSAVIIYSPPRAKATAPGINGFIAADALESTVLLDPVTGARRDLLKYGAEEEGPAWSPSGDRIAVSSGGDLVTVRSDGTGKSTLIGGICGGDWPTWSPDGTQIAYSGCSGLSIVDADGTDAHHVPNGGLIYPDWSPDGNWIAGVDMSIDGDLDIWKIHPDGSGLTQLTDLPGDQLVPTWSPDGLRIAFEDHQTSNWEIAVVGADGGAVTNLTQTAGRDYTPTWSPDGSAIAFGSTRSGGDIFTMEADGSDQVKVPNSEGITNPDWQPAQVVVRASATTVQAGSGVTVDVQVGWPGTTQPLVTVQRRTTSTSWADWRVVSVDGAGIATFDARIREHTWFRAVWPGDGAHLGGRSLDVLIQAAVHVEGSLSLHYRLSGRWHLYHVGRRIRYRSDVVPIQPDDNMCFELERFTEKRRWTRIRKKCFPIARDGTTTVLVVGVPKGERLRTRAFFRSSNRLLGDQAPWSYLRVTA